MAIKINEGAAPRYGRVTMPKGTYLSNQPKFSNPATAADGGLGAGSGDKLPPTPQIGLGADNPYNAPKPYNPFQPVLHAFQQVGNALSGINQQYIEAYKNQPALSVDQVRARFGDTAANYVQALNPLMNPQQQVTTNAFRAPSNTLVGQDLGTTPQFIAGRQLSQLFPGMSATDVQAVMAQKGYIRTYQSGVGEIWTKAAEGTQGQPPTSSSPAGNAASGELDSRGRPQYVDATALAPGERAQNSAGVGFTGGTDYTNAAGETVSQYAVSLPGAGDRWKYKIKQNDNGDWVRVYYRTFGRQNKRTKEANKIKQQQASQQQASQASPVEQSVETHQLVNLRADFG